MDLPQPQKGISKGWRDGLVGKVFVKPWVLSPEPMWKKGQPSSSCW